MGRKLSPEEEAAVERQVRAVRAAIAADKAKKPKPKPKPKPTITHNADGSTNFDFRS